MGMLSEFKEFAVRGNMVDMAVGIVVGTAFKNVVSSLVDHIVMPPIGLAIGGVDFADLAVTLKAGTDEVEPVLLAYGAFIQTCIDFLIIALAVFVAVKVVSTMQKRREQQREVAPETAPPPPEDVKLLMEIRDLLKARA
ncbi:MAG TPA: large-conductance mechanosensitive channel protein MscL [Xanthomonadaceae bacterium]|nr:large-conductance mechanosensitive channel protein MscL [Xanthomonadaceae bacterium]